MVLVDASVWIYSERFHVPVASLVARDEIIATCPIIMQEVLRGTHNRSHYRLSRALLLAAEMLDAPTPFERFDTAADIFLKCRDAGIMPRSSVDCLVVATALAYGATLLHDDRDFEHVKRVLPLKTLRPTRS
ncbi:MAG TPA: PIN domain nuclease [Thermoanaerobaculia bacterium]